MGAKVAKKIRIMRNLFLIIFKLHHYGIRNQYFVHKNTGKVIIVIDHNYSKQKRLSIVLSYRNIAGDILLNYLKV